MAEWSIALPWKGSNWVTGSGVRIPVSPPNHLPFFLSLNITMILFIHSLVLMHVKIYKSIK